MKDRDLDALDALPASWTDAIQEFVSGLGGFHVRIKPANPTVLQVPAGPGNDQVAVHIQGRWRWNTVTVERASPGGAARSMDVHVTTASDNAYQAGSPGEVDITDRSFQLALTDAGQAPAVGTGLARKVAVAQWNGSQFTGVQMLRGGLADELPQPQLVTALPSAPTDGQRVALLADPDQGAVWHLRYRLGSASTFKWEFLGGPPVRRVQTAALSATFGGAWQEIPGLQLVLPSRGDYEVTLSAHVLSGASPVNMQLLARALDSNQAHLGFAETGRGSLAASQDSRLGGTRSLGAANIARIHGLAAAPTASGPATVTDGELLVRPVRIA